MGERRDGGAATRRVAGVCAARSSVRFGRLGGDHRRADRALLVRSDQISGGPFFAIACDDVCVDPSHVLYAGISDLGPVGELSDSRFPSCFALARRRVLALGRCQDGKRLFRLGLLAHSCSQRASVDGLSRGNDDRWGYDRRPPEIGHVSANEKRQQRQRRRTSGGWHGFGRLNLGPLLACPAGSGSGRRSRGRTTLRVPCCHAWRNKMLRDWWKDPVERLDFEEGWGPCVPVRQKPGGAKGRLRDSAHIRPPT